MPMENCRCGASSDTFMRKRRAWWERLLFEAVYRCQSCNRRARVFLTGSRLDAEGFPMQTIAAPKRPD